MEENTTVSPNAIIACGWRGCRVSPSQSNDSPHRGVATAIPSRKHKEKNAMILRIIIPERVVRNKVLRVIIN